MDIQHTSAQTLFQQAFQYHQQGSLAQAETLYLEVLKEQPNHIDALHFFGVLKHQLGQEEQAVELISQSLQLAPNNSAAYCNLGLALHELKRYEQALTHYERALVINPHNVEALYNHGNALLALNRISEALQSYDKALAIKPDHADVLTNRGKALAELKRHEEALSYYERALAIQPHHANALAGRGHALQQFKRFKEAIENYGQALAIKPDLEFMFGTWLQAKLDLCDWDNLEQYLDQLTKGIEQGKKVAVPFTVLALSDSVALQKKANEIYANTKFPNALLLPAIPHYSHDKIKVGYFSSDFRNHPVAILTAGLFEHHDRSRFEIIAFSFHASPVKDETRLRLEQAFDQFIDVSEQTDAQIVRLARELEIDIAVDLNGFTDGLKTGIFAMRVAPIQVNYLGYSTTMGADYIDYIIADKVVIPDCYQSYYTENVVYLPHSYMANDNTRAIAETVFKRSDFGLPEQGFVFCCFNNSYKITPNIFNVWLQLLKQVSNSVLWLRASHTDTDNNLRHTANTQGIASERLIFAEKMPSLADHLARHRLADLFLDTLPYNAHTTTSDALWAGLPVVTCVGQSFASRVAASLLTAVGLPELITDNLQDYQHLALHLATHPDELAALRKKLAENRLTQPLFNTALFTQHLEAAYSAMIERYQHGLAPDRIDIVADSITSPSHINSQPLITKPQLEKALSYQQQGQTELAIAQLQQLVTLQPDNITAYEHLAALLRSTRRFTEALDSYEQVLKRVPKHTEALLARSHLLLTLNRLDLALNSYNQLLTIKTDMAEALFGRGMVLQLLKRFSEALNDYDAALAIDPTDEAVLIYRSMVLQKLNRLREAIASCEPVVTQHPDKYDFLLGDWLHNKMNACDWRDLTVYLALIQDKINQGKKIAAPFVLQSLFSDIALQKKAAEIYAQAKYAQITAQPFANKPTQEKIKVAYFSSDFRNHPIAYLTAELFECHDRSRFEIIGFSFNSEQDPMKQRLAQAFDHFYEVAQYYDKQVVELARDIGCDIAINLNGFTEGERTGIFAMRVAPIQVSYLGFLGTMGVDYIDYLIADPILIPPEHRVYYREKIVYLPHFQVNDSTLEIAECTATRTESGLPEQGFVYCCFNSVYKITPDMFNCWLRILKSVEGSVLWLLENNLDTQNNLKTVATTQGIAPERLIFAKRVPLSEHLARHNLADLFLDTLPCNAGATASTALWAGLPILTCLGTTFAGRMGASLLNAIELPELITDTLEQYEHLAIELAKQPERLTALKTKLALNRFRSPLFDTLLFTEHLETAYSTMLQRYQRGLAPDHLFIGDTATTNPVVPPAQTSTALFQQAFSLHQQGQLTEAAHCYQELLQIEPKHIDALHFLGVLCHQRGQHERAVTLIKQAITLNPQFAGAYSNLGLALHSLKRFDEALQSYDRALNLNPHHAETLSNKGNVLQELARYEEALACYALAIQHNPNCIEALYNQGVVAQVLHRFELALSSYQQVLAILPDYKFLFGTWLHLKMNLCNWQHLDDDLNELITGIENNKKISIPFTLLAMSASAVLQKKAAEIYVQAEHPDCSTPLKKYSHSKIKIGYFSGDFCPHPLAYLMSELFERHDRSQFEIIAFSFRHPTHKDPIRLRLENAFDSFIDVSEKTDEQVVQLARDLEIDIAVDLQGFTYGRRTNIFAMRVAPIQVNYLGYPATMGAGYMDYLLADSIVIPKEQQANYSEHIVYLPHCYQVNDSTLAIADKQFTRVEQGLPEQGIVFCCFNNHYKILPEVFACWMRILQQIDGSVLWFLTGNAQAEQNLRATANTFGIAENRLIFAGRLPISEHLARHALADLFLDTFPCNGGATASSALWAGLPVLTCAGAAFASRMAASLLNAVGLPELITDNLQHYETLAITLAKEPQKLLALKEKLAKNRLSYPLFDTALFTRHLETAYQLMVQRYQQGLAPETIYVSDSTQPTTTVTITPQHNNNNQLANQQFQQALQLHQQGQLAAAERLYDSVLSIEPQHADALHFFGVLKHQQGQLEQAVELIQQSLKIQSTNAAAHSNLALVLYELKRYEEAVLSCDKAIAIKPIPDAYCNRGNALQELNRIYEAIESYEKALAIKPDFEFFFGTCLHLKMKLCLWDNFSTQVQQLLAGTQRGEKRIVPFALLAVTDSAAIQKKAAEIYTQAKHPSQFLAPALKKHSHQKIKLGYFSSDFRNHPVAYLAAELFERHDKNRFELIAFSFHAGEKDAMRLRLEKAFDTFIDVSQHSDADIVQLARQLEIDIAIDLNGCTVGCRTDIFAMRVAPIQVSYLGYAGTMGADYIDYLIADKVVIPKQLQSYYSEKIAYLPHCFMVNDSQREISNTVFHRRDFGLPEQGFVFCCFNNSYKLTPALFDVWMDLLKQVNGSVLWLSESNSEVAKNLRNEASKRGVEPKRLIFAPRMASVADHLARQRLADLFLDALPYNAHTTTSDALWAGLPVLTCTGEAFASRVAASLLTAIGLPELITDNLQAYQATALRLANQPNELAALRQKLADNRLSQPLFNTALFTQHIEAAYSAMWQRYQQDLLPDYIEIAVDNDQPIPVIATAYSHDLQQAIALHEQGQWAEAEVLYQKILQAEPNHVETLLYFGNLLLQLGRLDQALQTYQQALLSQPHHLAVLCNRALVLQYQGQFEAALSGYDQVLSLNPNHADTLTNRGNVLKELKRFEEAVASYQRALAIEPNDIGTLTNLGNVFQQLERYDAALDSYNRALALDASNIVALYGKGFVYQLQKDFALAIACYQRVLDLQPDYYDFLRGTWLFLKMRVCDWQVFSEQLSQINSAVEQGKKVVTPFAMLAFSNSAALQQQVANIFVQTKHPSQVFNVPLTKHRHEKIKLGYFCADFCRHPTTYLMAELFERHDRSRFEIFAFSLSTGKEKDDIGLKMESVFEQFFDVGSWSDEDIVRLARELEIDIAVDLNGFTEGYRANLFAMRLAPIQVNYLAYTGTMGADYFDYLVADLIVIPEHLQRYYSEKIAYLPHNFQVSDSRREIPDLPLTRTELGLPEQGFVYCCFNNSFKINPDVFACWMRILQQVPDSVLWLLADNELAANHLHLAAIEHGIAAERLIFAKRVDLGTYFARQRLADLFLDTFPYNAHTTANDALWVGLPVLTRTGETLASRVAASLLTTIGLPELITDNLKDYEALAIRLAKQPKQLQAIRKKLAAHRLTTPVFDTELLTQHLEELYQIMYERYQADLAPDVLYIKKKPSGFKLLNLLGKLTTFTQQRKNQTDNKQYLQTLEDAQRLHRQGQFAAAELLYQDILKAQPNHKEALRGLQAVSKQLKKTVTTSTPASPPVVKAPSIAELLAQAQQLHHQQRWSEALAIYEQVLKRDAQHIEALILRGHLLEDLNRPIEALASYDQAIAKDANSARAYANRGNVLQILKRFDEAIASYDLALTIKADYAEVLYNRGNALQACQRYQAAIADYDKALAIRPDFVLAWLSRGNALHDSHQAEQALLSYERALSLDSRCAEALYNRGNVLMEIQRYADALASYQQALTIQPDYAEALIGCAIIFQELKQLDQALFHYQRALAIKPDLDFNFGDWLFMKLNVCDWRELDTAIQRLTDGIQHGKKMAMPFTLFAITDSADLQKKAAEIYTQANYPNALLPPALDKTSHDKIRIGYFSADFHEHATAYLMAELFERHDRTTFEITAFSLKPTPEKDAMRLRLEAAFDRFIDVSQRSDERIVRLARQLEIDIAVDLKGFTKNSRPKLFAMRLAPIQVNYLGYPSTMGADYMDYLLADKVLIPASYRRYYTEKIVYLPNSYQPNDRHRAISEQPLSRVECGLPAQGFVFCCFNNNYKITPAVFAVWMRLLQKIDGSVLWLLADNATAIKNLRSEANAYGVSAERLVFAERLPLAEHLARHRLADLFLDTLPCNAHTTASDALWAGLPVLTCTSETFSSRVAASLLSAIGLSELITNNLHDYQQLALELAENHTRLANIKAKLADRRLSDPLFDTPLFVQHLELAYRAMYQRYQQDLLPDVIDVAEFITASVPHEELDALIDRGNALEDDNSLEAALACYDEAIRLNPHYPRAHSNRGNVLQSLQRFEAAIASYNEALRIKPDYAEAFYNRGNALQALTRFEEALSSYQQALAIKANFDLALLGRAAVLQTLQRSEQALADYQRVLELESDCLPALVGAGMILQQLKRLPEAVDCYQRVLALEPNNTVILAHQGTALQLMKRIPEAIACYERALAIEPDYAFLLGACLHNKMRICAWQDFDRQLQQLYRNIAENKAVITPFALHALPSTAALQKQVAEMYAATKYPSVLSTPIPKHRHNKIKLAYFSSDFRNHHPIAYLMAELFACHDRARFEVIAFSFHATVQKDEMRLKLETVFDRFIDVSQLSDEQVVDLGRDLELDIAIDLNGFTEGARTQIFAMRVAPIQVSYLGFLGTMGATYMDYLLADKQLIPVSDQCHYVEKIVYLPNSFQVNDSRQTISNKVFTRRELELPEQGFVFCCFNNNFKIIPELFAVWMRILQQVPDSVLWLLAETDAAKQNLQLAATAHGIAPERLIFAEHLPLTEHLARHRVADLFLDTSPYNAGATASAALWAGLPVLTYLGNTFASRMGASLLSAIGLPELIADTVADYERLAIELASQPDKLIVIKHKLAAQRLTYPLFDTRLFTRHLEAAYSTMYQRYQHDLAPDTIEVELNTPAAVTDETELEQLIHQGHTLEDENRLLEALAYYEQAIALNANYARAYSNRGNVLQSLHRFNEAIDSYNQALAIKPDYAAAFYNRANALLKLNRFNDALASYDAALALDSQFVDALVGRGNVLQELKQFAKALASYEQALAIAPDYIQVQLNRSRVLHLLNRHEDALAAYEQVLSIAPDYVEAWVGRGGVLHDLKHLDAAIASYAKALTIEPQYEFLLGMYLHLKLLVCDWQELDTGIKQLIQAIEHGQKASLPFPMLSLSDSAALQKSVATMYSQENYPSCIDTPPKLIAQDKIKIAYLSSDFRNHPVSYLLAELVERHDRTRFEIIALSFSPTSDKDAMRLKLENIFDVFIDVSQQSSEQIVQQARELNIAIAVDLNGFTQHARTELFAMRIAPIQVNYLGYAGTLGADYMDYIIADKILIPEQYRSYYTEKVVYLPHSYMANDSKRAISDTVFKRSDFGLPEQGFVFCSFNNSYKISPQMFTVWMRLLQQINNSVLWLSDTHAQVISNLRHEAELRGVSANRLIFAKRLPSLAEHLARHRLADLFLDTLPYNAHTTASDALWAGLPVLTCTGSAFASRVAASLLSAIGLPELITDNLADYESLARQLANNLDQLNALKQKLAANRLSYPLFDTALFTQHLELAYAEMYRRCQNGLTVEDLEVAGLLTAPPIDTETLDTLINRGNALEDANRLEDALACYEEAIRLNPDYPRAHSNRGNVLQNLKQFEAAIASYQRALAIKPDYAAALYNRGNALQKLYRSTEALADYDAALAIEPSFMLAVMGRAVALQSLNRLNEALQGYQQVLTLQPDYVEALIAQAGLLQLFGRFNEAITCYQRAYTLTQDDALRVDCLHAKMKICAWQDFTQEMSALHHAIAQGKPLNPFPILALSTSAEQQKRIAECYAREKHPKVDLLPAITPYAHRKIKIGYFSADFQEHVTAYLMAELFERHDKNQFEIIAFSFHHQTEKDAMRLRLEAAFDQFIDVSQQSDEQVARLARALEIDIAIDLKGFTEWARTDIFALRTAPIQVNYLGYPSTMGAEYIDYLLADKVLIPDNNRHYYTEKIIYLPNSYQPNDTVNRPIAQRHLTRAECALPEQGMVFCCFNNSYKITPVVFACWMQILQQVEGSVLWLLDTHSSAVENLRLTAIAHGIAAERLVFAPRLPLAEHLARHQLADLFLDTLPYNAHTTASDALWAGLPVLTCTDETFASRVAASLLSAIGLPELITHSLEQYQHLAIELANDLSKLTALKAKLAANRLTQPLFDTALLAKHLEAAYLTIWQRYQQGLPPEHITVAQAVDSVSMSANSAQVNQTFQQALSLHQQGQLAQAKTLYQQVLAIEPQHVDTLHFLGVLLYQTGDSVKAAEFIQQALTISPNNLPAHENLAMVLQSLNRFEEALAHYDIYLADDANALDVLLGRGAVLQLLNRFDEALNHYQHILTLNPNQAAALFGQANVLYRLNRLEEALNSYSRSLAINPNSAEAFYNQGVVLEKLNRFDDALDSYQQAIRIKPDYAEVHHNIGSLFKKQNRYAEAIASYQTAIAYKAHYPEAYCNLINLQKDNGQITQAQASLEAALTAMPNNVDLRFIKLILTLPIMPKDAQASAAVPLQFDAALTELEQWVTSSTAAQQTLQQAGLLPLPFMLAYRSGNHLQRLARFGDLLTVRQQTPVLKQAKTKLKLAVVSHHFRRHSVWDVITRGLLANLNRQHFDLLLYHLGSLEDSETEFAKSLATHWRDTHTLNVNDTEAWLATLKKDAPDIIFYPEIGMDPSSARLAACRIAPLQVASWGHPVTTGLATIDLYFSGELLESPRADSHYRERLIRLPSTGCCTIPIPIKPEPLAPELLAELDRQTGARFIIAQSIYKFEPADDELYAEIAQVMPNSIFILLKDKKEGWVMDQIVTRLQQLFKQRGLNPERLVVISWQSMEKFQTLLDVCDVYLDCPSFSGYTTAWQTVHRGLPIVTLEGEFMRQRLASGLLRKIGITDTIASSRNDYVTIAKQLAEEALNPIHRAARRQAIKAAAIKADYDLSVVQAFEQTLIDTWQELN